MFLRSSWSLYPFAEFWGNCSSGLLRYVKHSTGLNYVLREAAALQAGGNPCRAEAIFPGLILIAGGPLTRGHQRVNLVHLSRLPDEVLSQICPSLLDTDGFCHLARSLRHFHHLPEHENNGLKIQSP